MDELNSIKYQYEKMIHVLNSNYNKLNDCYNNLIALKKQINNNFVINDKPYSSVELNNLIKNIEINKNKILNILLPQAKKQYNDVLLKISSL